MAGLKAVGVNRIGDCAFLAAIAMLAVLTNSVEFSVIFNTLGYYDNVYVSFFSYNIRYLVVINFFILIAVMAKSAQIGLHIWLADAMEGPTPVSALIHAATMVTAGIYLIIRISFIFELTPEVKVYIAYIGALTSFFGASVAAFQ
jgi:NADH:ubiquinone oxidoreductase subunit 5 (subunit L)/multisubunit Na+/H+ antiporter MnhA subunit